MKMNNIKLKLANGSTLSIAQHYEGGEMVCCEMAVIDQKGTNEPLFFFPNLSDFMKTVSQAIQREMIK